MILFKESSTRTILSFQLAINRLGYRNFMLNDSTSSANKGESLAETLATIAAMGVTLAVVRHDEALHSDSYALPVINAGDSIYNHPTQALADLYTLREIFGDRIRKGRERIKLLILGELSRSRVANSLIQLLLRFNFNIFLHDPYSPATTTIKLRENEAEVIDENEMKRIWAELDVLYLLRAQHERNISGIQKRGIMLLDTKRHRELNKNCVIMHPGPMTSEVENEVKILLEVPKKQVGNAVNIRMAVLEYMVDKHPIKVRKSGCL
jgi:aspartate carbamoyltransferase catalytic subunit